MICVRFNDPGQYRIRIRSRRVIDSEVMSNELALTIVPATKEWQHEMLEHAKAGLSGPDRGEASKVLRYLGTPEAARLMAANYLSPDLRPDFDLGLVSASAREASLDAMKALLVDPGFPVDGDFLLTLSILAMPVDVKESAADIRQEYEARLRQELRLALEKKRGEAAAVSKRTLLESR